MLSESGPINKSKLVGTDLQKSNTDRITNIGTVHKGRHLSRGGFFQKVMPNDGGVGFSQRTSSKLYDFWGKFRENNELLYFKRKHLLNYKQPLLLHLQCYCMVSKIIVSVCVENTVYSVIVSAVLVQCGLIAPELFFITILVYSINDAYNLTNVVFIHH